MCVCKTIDTHQRTLAFKGAGLVGVQHGRGVGGHYRGRLAHGGRLESYTELKARQFPIVCVICNENVCRIDVAMDELANVVQIVERLEDLRDMEKAIYFSFMFFFAGNVDFCTSIIMQVRVKLTPVCVCLWRA